MSGARIHSAAPALGAAGRVSPAAPPRGLRSAPWKAAAFAAMSRPTTDPSTAETSWGFVPIRSGRVVMQGARRVSVASTWEASSGAPAGGPAGDVHGILEILDRSFLVAWSAVEPADALDSIFGGGRRTWLRIAVDLGRLARALDRIEGRPAPLERSHLRATAEAYRVPASPTPDQVDDALTVATLFLVLATKLDERGYASVRSLLALSRPGASDRRSERPAPVWGPARSPYS